MLLIASSLMIAALLGGAGRVHKRLTQKINPSFDGATDWLNSQPLNLADLRGKVVLIDFWTYTCINWRRTLPYVREWAKKYKQQGLVVISVHTPEFSFEQKLENISRSIKEMNITYPVAVDNNYDVWRSFQNHYWPARYLIDAKGKIRFQKFGEGDYRESELQIQELLKEASGKNISDQILDLQPNGFETAADWKNLRSPENYLGHDRTEGFASPEKLFVDKRLVYSTPKQLKLNQWAVSGEWMIGNDRIMLSRGHGKITYRFHARDLNLIMGPTTEGATIKFRVLIDGASPGASHGLDIDSEGNGTLSDQRMYQLIRQEGTVIDREFQIEFLDPAAEAYNFTFG
jgi:thiol-disulfide isomerase/thioredoxin